MVENIPAGSNLLCRLVSYTNKDFSLTGLPNSLKLPIYNKHFLIKGNALSDPTLQTTTQTMSASRSVIDGATIENSSELEQYAHSIEPSPEHRDSVPRTTTTRTNPGGY
tara:strand:+ start:75 stop:401 length:327 start_codon:yes stop_codon:yes gene_type:complete